MDDGTLTGGFADPARDSALAFRAALNAMARPGRIYEIAGATPPAPLSPAAGTLLLVLADATAPVHLAGTVDNSAMRDWLTFHTGAPLVPREEAAFAVGRWAELLPLDAYRIGVPDYPDRSATLIVEMDGLSNTGARLTGPGIESAARLAVPDVEVLRDNAARFPLGLDVFFTSGTQVAALPRTTKLEAA